MKKESSNRAQLFLRRRKIQFTADFVMELFEKQNGFMTITDKYMKKNSKT